MSFNLGAVWASINLNTRGWDSPMKRVNRQLQLLHRNMRRTATSWNQMANQMIWNGGAVAAAVGVTTNSFISAADTAEKLRLRLRGMLGSVKEGNKLFETQAKFAGTVPQTYREIMESATLLSGVLRGGREEVEKYMPLLADLAAAYDLPMKVVTGNFIRMYSAGAQAADLFRERGITAMMGFKAGAKYTTEETMRIMWESWTKAGSKFKDAAVRLGKTWSGLMSMFQDKWFNFRRFVIEEAGIFDWLKESFAGLNKYISDNWMNMVAWVKVNRILIRSVIETILMLGGLGVALVTVGIALKALAFSLTLVSFAFSPLLLAISLVIAYLYVMRAVWSKVWEYWGPDLNRIGQSFTRWVNQLTDKLADFIGISEDGWGYFWEELLNATRDGMNITIGIFVGGFQYIGVLFDHFVKYVTRRITALVRSFEILGEMLSAAMERDTKKLRELALEQTKLLTILAAPPLKGALDAAHAANIAGIKKMKSAMLKDYIGFFEFIGAVAAKDLSQIWTDMQAAAGLTLDVVKEQFAADMDALIAIAEEKAPYLVEALKAFREGFIVPEIDTTIEQQINALLARLKKEFEHFRTSIKDIFYDIGEDFENAFTKAFSGVLQGQMTFKEASKRFVDDMYKYLADETARSIAKRLRSILIGQTKEETMARALAIKKVLIERWQAMETGGIINWLSGVKIAQAILDSTKILSIAKLTALGELAIEKWKALKLVAIAIWEATAQFIKAHASIPYVGLAMGIAFAGAAVAAIAAARGSFLTGTDYVPETGPYVLHRGEQVLSRPEVDQRDAKGGDINLVTLFTTEGFAAGMATQEGHNVIVQAVTKDLMENGQIRRVLRETASV